MFRVLSAALFFLLILPGCNQGAAPDASPSTANMDGPGWTTTPSGLKYKDLQAGTGASPKPGDIIRMKYTGWLMNGTKFDSSADHGGAPFTFRLGEREVIPGWEEAVATMKVGGKRILVIPPQLAYGAQGSPPTIPPNSTLKFEVEFVGME